MSTPAAIRTDVPEQLGVPASWSIAARLLFRFCFLYFGLFCIFTQILGGLFPFPGLDFPDFASLPPFRQVVFWTARNVFHYQQPLVFQGSGSGDKVFDWVLAFCLLVFSVAATLVWTALPRRSKDHDRLYAAFRLFIRFALASTLFSYGLAKILPMQMPFPFLTRLLEPYGNFSPMGALWFSIGASPAYEAFAGSAEMLAGLLLVVPATSMLGALLALVDLVQIFALNLTYDIPVKLFSFHLLLFSVILLWPERSRLLRFCLLDRPVGASSTIRLFGGNRANQRATVAQVFFGLLLVGLYTYGTVKQWYVWGDGRPKSPLYGIWNVDEMAVDGVIRAPLLNDYDRWRRLIFEFPGVTAFQRMDDSFAQFASNFDAKKHTLTLTKNDDKKWKGQLSVDRSNADGMRVEGQMGSHSVRMQLSRFDRSKFLLVSRGFHWAQDYPFNR